MPVLFNGTTGYLTHSAKIISGYPFSIICWGTRASSSTAQAWISQSQTAGDRYVAGVHAASSETKQALLKEPGSSRGVNKGTTPNTSSTTLQLMAVVFTSTTSRTVYFGDGTSATDTASVADGITNHNLSMIGARQYNSLAVEFFANGSLAEAHWFNSALTSTNITDMIADTVKPEAVSGWVDGWILKDYQAGGTYTSIGGTRTMTAVGGVSASSATHPIARAANVTINATVGNATADGALATITNGQVTISCTVGNAAANGSTAGIIVPQTIACTTGNATASGSTASISNKIMSDIIINNTGTPRPAESANWYWHAGGLSASAATSSGTTVTDANARLSPGITYTAGDLILKIGTDVYFESFA